MKGAKGEGRLTHLDEAGRSRMVDVGAKDVTRRRAVAEAVVRISARLAEQVTANRIAKGNLLEVARLAGMQAAKRTAELIPLCHNVPLDHVQVDAWLEDDRVRLRSEASTTARTGVEMEALTAACVAALTVIDMGKAVDRAMVIESVRLIEKSGGRSGPFRAPEASAGRSG